MYIFKNIHVHVCILWLPDHDSIIRYSLHICCLFAQMWEKVKSGNPSMGVCEISATIGRMWRELGADEKQRHNDDYTLDKVCIFLDILDTIQVPFCVQATHQKYFLRDHFSNLLNLSSIAILKFGQQCHAHKC